MDDLTALGLGLDYGTVRLERTSQSWVLAGATLRDDVTELLGALAVSIEQIGSSSVLGLLAKPIIDLAAGVETDQNLDLVVAALEAAGWIYRGDANAEGGHVFVLESRPWHRVAHLHVVQYDSPEWVRYLRLRDLLRARPSAASRYEAVKLRLANQYPGDHRAYTTGKSQVVSELLEGPA
jgi:GrpB-like predicted nucleotidyltransferase (UPF0157 family)